MPPLSATIRLGKRDPRHDPRTLRLADYVRPAALPPSPPSVSWDRTAGQLPLWGNDAVGDCTCAAAAGMIAVWTQAATSKAVLLETSEVLAGYSAVTGYDPANPRSDRGAVMLDVLKYWRTAGIAGHQIRAFLQIDRTVNWELDAAINLFGGIYAGFALPLMAQQQIDAGKAWSAPYLPWGIAAPGSWGGHAVGIFGYEPAYLYCRTWGRRQALTWGFLRTYADELYAVLSDDWISAAGKAPSGFDLPALEADLAAL